MNARWHSAYPDLDNCYRDHAQRNASELADLLAGMEGLLFPRTLPTLVDHLGLDTAITGSLMSRVGQKDRVTWLGTPSVRSVA